MSLNDGFIRKAMADLCNMSLHQWTRQTFMLMIFVKGFELSD